MKDKIGVGILTCNRPDFLKKCISSINSDWYDTMVIVNDGDQAINTSKVHIINNDNNLGVGKSKNIALKFLIENECEHLFLVEDDVIFKKNAFEAYINASRKTRVKHFNYCLHGQDNKANNQPNPRQILDIRGVKVSLYFNVYGACSYYHKSVINDIGYMDEQYYNAMEHVDHTMRAINKKYHPPFRWFIDLENSNEYLTDQDYNHDKSTIRKDDWIKNFQNGIKLFKQKYNIDVTSPYQSYDDLESVINYFKAL